MNYITINKVFHYRARKTPTPVPFQIHNCIKKNSKNCDLWKITRQHKKIFNTDIDNLFTNCIKLDLFIIQNWYQNFHLFLHVETNKYNRDSKFILCNPSIQSLGSQGARKKNCTNWSSPNNWSHSASQRATVNSPKTPHQSLQVECFIQHKITRQI